MEVLDTAQPGGWRAGPSLRTARLSLGLAAVGRFLYAAGGSRDRSGSGALIASVEVKSAVAGGSGKQGWVGYELVKVSERSRKLVKHSQ